MWEKEEEIVARDDRRTGWGKAAPVSRYASVHLEYFHPIPSRGDKTDNYQL